MRILCLHDINSSAPILLTQIHEFAKKLHDKHGIELAFVNSPLIVHTSGQGGGVTTSTDDDSTCSNSTFSDNDNKNNSSDNRNDATPCTSNSDDNNNYNGISIENNDDSSKRTWYYTNNSNNDTIGNVKTKSVLTGLDASILYLHQIWKQSYYTKHPFCGILGIGQGAAIAALIPLLQTMNIDTDDTDNDNIDTDDKTMAMFEGIQFCIFCNGYDLIEHNFDHENDKNNNSFYYDQVQNIPSLHIISSSPPSSSINNNDNNSMKLYQHYGGKLSSSCAQLHLLVQHDNNDTSLLIKNTSILNCIGKFLVQQKKISKQKRQKLIQIIKNNSNNDKNGNEDNNDNHKIINDSDCIEAMIEKLQMKLAIVEEKAHSIMTTTIALNPPKALMAIITPPELSKNDGTLVVGGWTGGTKDSFRSKEFKESGGAPCPKSFVLKPEDR